MNLSRFSCQNLLCSDVEYRLCHCPDQRNHGRGSDLDHSPIHRGTTDHAIRHTSLRTIRCSTKAPSTMGRTIRCNTTDCSIPKNIHSTKGHNTKVSTSHRSTKDSRPNRLRCRMDGSMSTMKSRTKVDRPPMFQIRFRKDRRTWCCLCC